MGKTMKRMTVLLAVLTVAVFLITACGKQAGGTAEPAQPQAETAEESAETGADEAASGETPEEAAAPAAVDAVWAEEIGTDGSLFFAADTDSDTKVAFITDKTVTEFKVLSVRVEGISEDGKAEISAETVYLQEKLEPGQPLVVNMTFYGDLPNYGIAYTDADGTVRSFTVSISGDDGSVVLSEF